MLNKIPAEIIRIMFDILESPNDYAHLASTCWKAYIISLSPTLRRNLLKKFFHPQRTLELFGQSYAGMHSELCEFIEASKVKPKSNDVLQVMEEQIDTSHFIHFEYKSSLAKGKVLNVFRSKCQRIEDGFVAVVSQTSKAILSTRHITETGPRRIYYDIPVPFINQSEKRFKWVFYDLFAVVTFEDDELCTLHRGTMYFKDEDIQSDFSWQTIFQAKENQATHMVLPSSSNSSLSAKTKESLDTNKLRNDGSNILNTTVKFPLNWQPCLLHTYQDCTLRTKIKKGWFTKESSI
ncbi:MAG: hypothetical protein EXX96DRAFT_541412 [Benjaminiella poitrasii]|nr:MAG: hypothetical protein EXX96DRAFT_541412 [Benjaminiella poitrasii]